jgi:hypothetical protein
MHDQVIDFANYPLNTAVFAFSFNTLQAISDGTIQNSKAAPKSLFKAGMV